MRFCVLQRLIALFAIALAAVFIGCGDDDDDDDDDDATDEINVLQGRITANTTLEAAREHLLRSAVFIEAGATLTIEPGTTIFGEGATNGTLVIARGGRIVADGTATNPIVFTSDAPEGSQGRGQWGGLIINGSAPINQGAEAFGEGDTGAYGGNNPADSSGILRYVRVEYAGIEFSPDNELNGIAFQGVGSGTVVEHVQVHFNQDDGIEMFGGTVNIKYAVVSGARDDSFDWTDGWTGKGQFWVALQRGDDADNGFEVDNLAVDNEATPRSNATIYNVTLVGDPNGPKSDTGLLLREGSAGTYRNFIVTGFNAAGVEVNGASSQALAQSGDLTVRNSIFFNNKPGNFAEPADGFDARAWAMQAANNNAEVDPKLIDAFNQTNPDFRPSPDSPAVDGTVPVAQPPSDGFFESVNFIGGVGPNDNWLAGWTNFTQP